MFSTTGADEDGEAGQALCALLRALGHESRTVLLAVLRARGYARYLFVALAVHQAFLVERPTLSRAFPLVADHPALPL
jgi:uncharacterized protein YgbK (DUF1537 family)